MLKEKLEILIERLTDRDAAQRDYALKEFKTEISGATSSMTSVPKPLKFLSPHYKRIVEIYELQIDSEFKVSKTEKRDSEQQSPRLLPSINQILQLKFADFVSVLGMVASDDDKPDCLTYCLQGSRVNLVSWGHEYLRCLAG